MIRAEERIRAVAADRMTSETLGVPEGTPLLSVERVTYTWGPACRVASWALFDRRALLSQRIELNELN